MRNHERPLNIIQMEGGSIAYASEPWIAIGPCSRNYMKVKEVITLHPGNLYSIDLREMQPKLTTEVIPKKATPSVTHTSTVIGGITKQIVGIGKRQVKNVLNSVRSNYVGFFIDDLQCTAFDPNPAEVYDYIFTGTHDDYPGTVFKFHSKDLFPYEADEMLGKYVSAVYQEHSFIKGNILEVWVTRPVWTPSKPKQPVCH
jgi:hypothetical protein